MTLTKKPLRRRRGKRKRKRKPLSADLPRIEVIHELAEHKLTYVCGCRKHAIGEETSEQLDIVPMQIRVIRRIRKVYGCAPDSGALGDPVQRTLSATAEFDAPPLAGKPSDPLR